jgi:aminoglycoside 3-N-acetyltransferase I
MQVIVTKLSRQDLDKFIELIHVFENVFEMENFKIPNKSHLKELLNNENFIVFVALLDNKVVGGLTAYTLQQYYSVLPLVYVYDLAINKELQRQGIGKKLINDLNSFCKLSNIEEVFIQAEIEDDYAIDFYRLTGGQESNIINFSYKLNDQKV